MPGPRGTQRGAREPVEGQGCRRLTAEDPGRRVIGRGEALQARPHRWLAEDEADARGRGGPAVGVGIIAQTEEPARATQADEGRCRALAQASQVLTEARLGRPLCPTVETLDEPAYQPEGILERQPRVAFAELGPAEWADVAGRHTQRRAPARSAAETTRRQDRVEQGEAQCGHDRSGPQVALDPLEDRTETHELAAGVEIEQLVGQALGAGDLREADAQRGPHRRRTDVGSRAPDIVGVERRLALLRAAALVATDRAAVLPRGRPDPSGDPGLIVHGPDDLIGDQHPTAGGAARREEIPDRDLEAGLPSRRSRETLEGGVEMPDVGRPQDDLREHPGQGAGLERDGAALTVHCRPGHPPATPEQIGDDLPRSRVQVDAGRDDRRRRSGREAVEDRKRIAWLGVEGSATGHRTDASRRTLPLVGA